MTNREDEYEPTDVEIAEMQLFFAQMDLERSQKMLSECIARSDLSAQCRQPSISTLGGQR